MLQASDEILDECIACGGSVTGEHGIGVEKISFMSKMFTDERLEPRCGICATPSIPANASARAKCCRPPAAAAWNKSIPAGERHCKYCEKRDCCADSLPISETIEPSEQAGVAACVRDAFESETAVYPISSANQSGLWSSGETTRSRIRIAAAESDSRLSRPRHDGYS